MTACTACGVGGQPDGARFCFSCGGSLQAATCSTCATEIVPGARFCGNCGSAQNGAVAAPQSPATTASAPVSARRVTSVLFADLVGFTSLSEVRDQEEVRELLTRYFEECQQIIARYGGTVEKFIGDAVMAVWGVPTSHEDDAERAVRAGLELVNAIAAMGADVGIPDLRLRAGIVTGEVAVTIGAQGQGMVAGDAVNTAARVQSAAAPGQVWVDETTRLLTSSSITYVDVGSHQMKGKVDPMPLWAVRAVVASMGGAQRADGLEAPHVGRDHELRLVKELFHRVEETKRPALLVVDGEPGVGKTRLGWEFSKYTDGLSSTMKWHSGRCLAYGEGVAFFALAEAIRGRLQRVRGGDAEDSGDFEDQAALLAGGLDHYVPDAQERAWLEPRLGVLLGVGSVGTFAREDLFSAWVTFLHRVSEDQHPVVLLIDDAQHADDGMVLFIEHLLSVGSFACFVALLTRPGLLEDHPALATNRRATVLHLEALEEREMGELLDGLVSGLPPAVRDSLVERAEGIPLFAVETVRSLIDRDLVIPRAGQYVLANPEALDLDTIGAPASLQALIAARLDTLSSEQRRVVDQASVVGNSFARESIAQLCGEVSDLDGALTGLVRLQILKQEANQFSTERGHYQFVQSAVRQVAYASLARRDRKASHLAVIDQLEQVDDAAGELAPIIAQHYLEALDAVPDDADLARLTGAAIGQLRRAAARAQALGASAEAAAHLTSALARATEPAEHAAIERDLARALVNSGSYEAAKEHAEAAIAAFDRLEDAVSAGSGAAVLAQALQSGYGDNEGALGVAQERYQQLLDREDAVQVCLDLSGVIVTSMLRIPLNVRDIVDERMRLAERIGDETAVADSYVSLAVHYLNEGTHGLSRVLLESGAAIARRNHDSVALARALVNLNADWNQDDAAKAVAFGRESVEVARSTGVRYWSDFAETNLVLALWLHGSWDELPNLLQSDFAADDHTLPVREFVQGQVHIARGEPWTLGWEAGSPTSSDDSSFLTWRQMAEALYACRQGDLAVASRWGLEAVERAYVLSGLFDDFFVAWFTASEIALAADDHAVLDRLEQIVRDHRVSNPPAGLRAQLSRVAGKVAIRDGAEPALVERHFRAAINDCDSWHGETLGARCRAELGVWLTRQGRAAEGDPLLDRARETYTRLGAVRWAKDLDEALAGAFLTTGVS